MSATLNNVATTDIYNGAKVLLTGAVRANVQVSNAAVFMEPTFRDVDGTTTIGAENFLIPGFYSFSRPVNQLRFRSAVAGIPGRVNAELLLRREVA